MGWMAITDHDMNELGVYGDEPWDIMGDAIQQIKECYKKHWHREPTSAEIMHTFMFVLEDQEEMIAEMENWR